MNFHRDKRGKFRCAETCKYKMANHFGKFKEAEEALFYEMAAEKYDFASSSCKSGEKMTFGKCQKVGGSGDKGKKKKDTEVAAITDAGMDKAAKMYGGSNQKRVDAIRKSLGEINAAARATREA